LQEGPPVTCVIFQSEIFRALLYYVALLLSQLLCVLEVNLCPCLMCTDYCLAFFMDSVFYAYSWPIVRNVNL
jgi:hypothetical protein